MPGSRRVTVARRNLMRRRFYGASRPSASNLVRGPAPSSRRRIKGGEGPPGSPFASSSGRVSWGMPYWAGQALLSIAPTRRAGLAHSAHVRRIRHSPRARRATPFPRSGCGCSGGRSGRKRISRGLVGNIALAEANAGAAAGLRYQALQNRKRRRHPASGRLPRGGQRFESPQLRQELTD
jgi:hypothetical protein